MRGKTKDIAKVGNSMFAPQLAQSNPKRSIRALLHASVRHWANFLCHKITDFQNGVSGVLVQ
jgi:hypothetical protein